MDDRSLSAAIVSYVSYRTFVRRNVSVSWLLMDMEYSVESDALDQLVDEVTSIATSVQALVVIVIVI